MSHSLNAATASEADSRGEQIVRTQRILVEVNSLTALSEQLRDPLGGDLRVGIIPTVAPYLLPKVLVLLQKAFPNLRFS